MTDPIRAFPLQWPPGWRRMPSWQRASAKFRKGKGGWTESQYVSAKSLTIKEGAKAVLTLARGSEEMHALADRVGSFAVLVFADPKEFTEGMHVIKAQADQRDLLDDAA